MGHTYLGVDLAPGALPVGGCRRQACQSLAVLGTLLVRGNPGQMAIGSKWWGAAGPRRGRGWGNGGVSPETQGRM